MGKFHSKLDRREMDDLLHGTHFTEFELREWFKGFKKDCPGGYLRKEQFIKMYKKEFPKGNARDFAEHVFRRFDVNNDGRIDFREFVVSLSITSRGSMDEKLHWAFDIYDLDGDGYITKEEMVEIMEAIYSTYYGSSGPKKGEMPARERVEKIFRQLDFNRDGVLTLSEFMRGAKMDRILALALSKHVES